MAPLTGVTMVQRMTYRGDNTEEWSNNYHFRDAPPSTSADWDTLVNALAQIVKPVIPNTIEIVRAYGYNDDSDKPVSVYAKDWLTEGAPIAGTFAPGVNDHHMSGDQAYYATWQLDSRNARGKWIYLRKYLHGGIVAPTNPDIPDNAYRGAVDTYARALGTPAGGFHGGLRSRKTSAPILWTGTSDYITTRTLKRRGKRPLAH
jgi:hypothetical protein